MSVLRIYATAFNNANRVKRCIDSLKKLHPFKMYVVDNYSTDGTYELLKSFSNIKVTRYNCKRGKGRDIALKMLLNYAEPEDPVIYVDLDTIYKKEYIDFIKNKMKMLKDNVIYYNMGSLSNAKTNAALFWRNLNAHEDVERCARALASGITVYRLKDGDTYWDNESVKNGPREGRYARGQISKYKRFLVHLIDDERGGAFKSFREFYSISDKKNLQYTFGYLVAYIIARLLGIYSYDKKLNNRAYINENITDI